MSACTPVTAGPACSNGCSSTATTSSRRDSTGADFTDLDDQDLPAATGGPTSCRVCRAITRSRSSCSMLGGNDLKPYFGRTPRAVADALGGYVDDVAAGVTDRRGRVPMTVLVGRSRSTTPPRGPGPGRRQRRPRHPRPRPGTGGADPSGGAGARCGVRRRCAGCPPGRRRAPPQPRLTRPARGAARWKDLDRVPGSPRRGWGPAHRVVTSPPSMTKSLPVMFADRSLARNSTRSATSCGGVKRPVDALGGGLRRRRRRGRRRWPRRPSRRRRRSPSHRSVLTGPGLTVLTRTPRARPPWTATCRSWSARALAAL